MNGNKVILISIDGMRPDGLKQCGSSAMEALEKKCAYTYAGRTVFPSVTLPCHFSMTHAVTPERHGILTNTYTPQVRPVKGIFEKISDAGGVSAFCYGWEPLRDVAMPGALKFARYMHCSMGDSTDTTLTDEAAEIIDRHHPDFVFLYMAETDAEGHDSGWMSEAYLRRVQIAFDNAARIVEQYGDEYRVLITADHGGHDRSHGSEMDEDMIIPLFCFGPEFEAGKELQDVSILDITPTVASIMGIRPEPEWEGKSLI